MCRLFGAWRQKEGNGNTILEEARAISNVSTEQWLWVQSMFPAVEALSCISHSRFGLVSTKSYRSLGKALI